MTVATAPPEAPLSDLTGLLRREEALTRVLGGSDTTLAVAGPAQPFVLAGLLRASERRPFLVVTATDAEADRMAGDLACFVAADGREPPPAKAAGGDVAGVLVHPVLRLPAWETLPFERVSPDVATMGHRLAVLWQLAGGGADPPRVVVASVRALLQRLAPGPEPAAPLVVRPGDRLDTGEVVASLVAAGYRRELQVENRGELAVRGGIVDVFPSTASSPVRIDLW